MVKLDTTKMKPNNPGLSYVTPQALPGKFSNLGAAAKMTDTLVQSAVALDKRLTIDQADRLAKQLGNEYETSSTTGTQNLLTDKENLEDQLETDPKNEELQAKLDAVTQKYEIAKEQGVISSYEFERRILKDTQDLANANPAYQDEIAARVNKTLNNIGTLDLLKRDAALLKVQQDAEIKEFAAIKKYLTDKKKRNTLGMSREAILATYTKELYEDRLREGAIQILSDNNLNDKVKRARVRENIDLLGGPAKATSGMLRTVFLELENVSKRLGRGEISVNDAGATRDQILIAARTSLTNFATIMGDDDAYKAAYENVKTELDKLTGTTFNRMLGNDSKTFYDNQQSVSDAKALFNFEEKSGLNVKMMKVQSELIASFDAFKKNLNVSLSQQQSNMLINNYMMITTNPNASGMTLKGFKERPDVVIKNSLLFNEVLETQIDQETDISQQPEAFGVMNNLFSTVKSQDNANTKYTTAKQLLSTINGDAYERTLPYMMGKNSSGSQWQQDLPETLEYFRSATHNNMKILGHTKNTFYVQDGRILSKVGVNQAREMAESMTINMQLLAKVQGNDKLKDEDANEFLDKMLGAK